MTATYALTQADAGAVDNTATDTGTPPTGEPPVSDNETTVPVDSAPGITLDKSRAIPEDAAGVTGDIVTYTFTMANTGNVTLADVNTSSTQLTGVSITDELEGPVGDPLRRVAQRQG